MQKTKTAKRLFSLITILTRMMDESVRVEFTLQ